MLCFPNQMADLLSSYFFLDGFNAHPVIDLSVFFGNWLPEAHGSWVIFGSPFTQF